MTKPTTKNEIIEAAQTEHAALEKLLTTLTPEQMTQSKSAATDDWSAKDVLAHLIEWEGMVMKWYETGTKGKVPAVPSEEYNWAKLPQLNTPSTSNTVTGHWRTFKRSSSPRTRRS
jgi:hypothetical protein